MAGPSLRDRLRKVIVEAHRRSLWQVMGLYIAVSWIGYEVILDITQGVGLPDWVPPLAIVLFIIGLPLVLATAFVQEGLPIDRSAKSDRETPAEPERRTPSEPPAPIAADSAPDSPAGRPASARFLTWPKAITVGVLAFALLGLAATGFLAMRTLGIGPAATLVANGTLDERAPLVMSDFVAVSGDSSLAAVVTEGLRADLEQSTFVTVADRTQIRETLQRMMRPADTRLDPATAREVALRLGLKADIEGEVGRAGAGYILTARVVTADSGRTLATFRETADDSTKLVRAIGALSHDMRERIGESLKSVRASTPLMQATTPSLPALRLAVEAYREEAASRRPRAMRLARDAIQIDTAFAWAWLELAVFHYNNGDRSATLDAVDHALQHADRLDESRRIYAQQMRAGLVGDHRTSVDLSREALLRDSLDAKSWIALSDEYWTHGEWEDAVDAARKGIELSPESWVARWNLVVALIDGGRTADAREAAHRAAEQLPQSGAVSELRVMTLAAAEQWDSIRAMGPVMPRAKVLADQVMGRWAEADRYMTRSSTPPDPGFRRWLDASARILVLGDTTSLAWLRAQLDSVGAEGNEMREAGLAEFALLAAIAGDSSTSARARRAYEERVVPPARWPDAWILDAADGFIALHDGDGERAIASLRQARESTAWTAPVDAFLGRAYDTLGRRDSAIAAYSRYLDTPWAYRAAANAGVSDRTLLVPIHARLAALFQESGNTAEAVRHASAVVRLWGHADPELQPTVASARRILERASREGGPG